MPIFSRRILQNMINENAKLLNKEQLSRHIRSLNKANEESISFEWEVVLLYALSKLGNVVYEQNLGGKQRPDLYFTSKNGSNPSFVADIVTVSDRGYEAKNPLESFINELSRLRKKYGLKHGGFSWKIGGATEGPFRDQKMKLKLPSRGELHNIFNDKFHYFMRKIKSNPSLPESFIIKTMFVDIEILYNPNQRYDFRNYPSYTVAYSLTKNPVYNDLKSKRNQLKKTNYNGLLSIFLCDGGCNLFRDKMYSPFKYNLADVISYFLKRTSTISLIITFTVKRSLNSFHLLGKPYAEIQFFTNSPLIMNLGNQLINELAKVIPEPVTDVINALNHLKSKYRKEGISHYGGLEMSRKTAKISSRALLALLAGRIPQEKFLKDHGLISSERHRDAINLFELNLREGRLISEIRIEKSSDEDDDRIIIEFGNPDPAISPFAVPQK